MTIITANNYSTATSNINFNNAPSALKQGNEDFQEMREFYNEDQTIKETIDEYIDKLNQWVSSNSKHTEVKKQARTNTPLPKKEETVKKDKPKAVKKPKKEKATKKVKVKKVGAKKVAAKVVVKPKAIKNSKIKSPELALIVAFISLNKRSISIKSFETKLEASKHLETVKHRSIIDEIKTKLQKAIKAAKEDNSNNGRITATIDPKFLIECRETVKNAKELLRVSYFGQISKVNPGVKPSRKLRPVKFKKNTYTDATGKGAGSHHGGVKKKTLSGVDNSALSNDVMDMGNMDKTKFDLLGLDGKYLQLIGEACKPTNIFIYGPGGSGKSTLTLNFSYYLAKKGNTILYVAGEQFGTPVFIKALLRLGIKKHPNLTIVRNLEALNPAHYDMIVLDSKDSLEVEIDEFKDLLKKYPKQSFIILSQGTKAGDFTGSEKWRNIIDTMIYCEDMVAMTTGDKNRWGGKGEMKILVENK